MKLDGVWTAMATPFNAKGELDIEGLEKNVSYQIQGEVSGLLVNGSTGESLFLTEKEKIKTIETVKKASQREVPVMAGTGEPSTKATVEATKQARDAGADCVLVVTPFYVKPTPLGLISHYEEVAKVGLPVIVYHNPGRACCTLSVDTLFELSQIEGVAGIKESSSDVNLASSILPFCNENFTFLSGEDALTYPLCLLGAKGVISVASNVAPKLVSELVEACRTGNIEKGKTLHFSLFPLIKLLFIESNPIPVKAAMAMLGLPAGNPREPLMPMTTPNRDLLKAQLELLKLLEPVHG